MSGAGRQKVLYIVGLGRSGSTILANSLGQIDGFFSAGELNFIWRFNVLENRLCGCGRPFHECPVWNGVFDEAFGGMKASDAYRMISLRSEGTRTRHLPLMLTQRGTSALRGRLRGYLDNTNRLYRAIGTVTDSRVIVDSSKEPAYGYTISMLDEVDFYALHLVRDPRAAAYSWSKKKLQPDTDTREFMHRHSPAKSAALWDSWNAAAETLWRGAPERYLRLRYEDFVADPRASFTRILDLIGERDAELPLASDREVKLGVSHTVSGNPNRFDTGAVELRPDREWRRKMRPRDRNLVTALTLPLLTRYHYPTVPKA